MAGDKIQILSSAALQALYKKKGRRYPPNAMILLEEGRGDEMYIIVDGNVEITKAYPPGEDGGESKIVVLAVLGPGEFFGEMALLNDAPRMASARALTQVDCIVLNKGELDSLLSTHPRLATEILRCVSERLRAAFEVYPGR